MVPRAALPARLQNAGKPGANHVPAMKVLLVEDNPVNQKIAVRMLQKLGNEVDVAGNGLEGVEMFRASTYAAILMDVSMPVMDGLEATRKIRELERTRGGHVPVVALTANAMDGDRERCMNAGMDEYLSKPVRSEDLEETLRRIALHAHR
jgi:CheY-like chemotaxis protein